MTPPWLRPPRGHITRLLSAQALANAVFVLTDAIYLQAWWASPFEPGQTSTGRFTSAGGQSGPAHFLTGGGYASVTSRGWTGVSLPYQGGRLSMTAVLPPAGDGADGCPDLTARALAGLAKPLSAGHGTQGTAVVLPEINLRAQETLNGLLSKLGMAVAFTSAADFTGMSPVAGSIGEVEHAATLRVDARGTVASAATAVTILPSAGRQVGPTVVFNRPYLLLVSAASTGEPLFLARVANPDLP